MTAHDATLRFNAGLTNNGSLAFTTGQTDLFGNVTNTSTGRIAVCGQGRVTYYGDLAHNNTTTPIQVMTAGSVATYFGAVTGPGNFSGTGTNFFEGDLRPGASPALVTFGGDVGFGAGARFLVELGGPTLGLHYDSADVAGTAVLGGVLDVDLIDGFQPQAGQQFTVLTFGSRVGDFAAYRDLDLGNGLGLVPVLHRPRADVDGHPGAGAGGDGRGGLAVIGWGGPPPAVGETELESPCLRCAREPSAGAKRKRRIARVRPACSPSA